VTIGQDAYAKQYPILKKEKGVGFEIGLLLY